MASETNNGSVEARSSRQRYRRFVDDYKNRRLDNLDDSGNDNSEEKKDEEKPAPERKAKRREYMREYLRSLKPYRWSFVVVIALSLSRAALEMAEPLFLRFII